jgi:hypothetical protein
MLCDAMFCRSTKKTTSRMLPMWMQEEKKREGETYPPPPTLWLNLVQPREFQIDERERREYLVFAAKKEDISTGVTC